MPMLASDLAAPLGLTFFGGIRLHHREAGLTEPSGLSIRGENGYFVGSDDTSAFFVAGAEERIVDRNEIAPSTQELIGIEYDPARQRLA